MPRGHLVAAELRKKFRLVTGQRLFLVTAVTLVFFGAAGCSVDEVDEPEVEKPAIYLYPTDETEVSVKLDFGGKLGVTYPDYGDGWEVSAFPDGRIVNKQDGEEYSYLFWEGEADAQYDLSKGFVVPGDGTAAFLREKLAYLGLTPREYNEFIVYWLPRMVNNRYNLITFQTDDYTDHAVLEVTPKPDSIQRVFMVFKPLDKPVEIPEQPLEPFEREGFALIEWGGAEL